MITTPHRAAVLGTAVLVTEKPVVVQQRISRFPSLRNPSVPIPHQLLRVLARDIS